MLRKATLLCTLIVLLAGRAAAADPVVRFLQPRGGQVVLGATTFRFEVRSHQPEVERVDVYCGGQLLGTARPPSWTLATDVPPGRSGAACLAAAYSGERLIDKARIDTLAVGTPEAVEVRRVQIYPVITDRLGNFVPDLKRSDFELLEDGRPVPIQSFANDVNTLSLSLLLDVSGSMGDRIALVQAAADEFVGRLHPGEKVSVFAFNESLRPVLRATADHARITAAIDGLEAGGSTALYDALTQILHRTDGEPGRKVVLVFSDGKDERSITSVANVVDAALRSDALVYTVATVHPEDGPRYLEDLQRLAVSTGGRAFPVRSMEDLRGIFESITNDLRAQYAVSFQPAPGPAGVRHITLRAKNKPHLTIRARTEYFHGAK